MKYDRGSDHWAHALTDAIINQVCLVVPDVTPKQRWEMRERIGSLCVELLKSMQGTIDNLVDLQTKAVTCHVCRFIVRKDE
jgi:hypothetical protein